MSSLLTARRFAIAACLICLSCPSSPAADEPIRLQERFPVGYEYHVRTRVDVSGTLTLPPPLSPPFRGG